jgi:hypothetical protein
MSSALDGSKRFTDSGRLDLLIGLLIALLWLAMLVAANPSGNFPLNDDWNYARSVLTILQYGKLEITCWNCSTDIFQIIYGALVGKIFGFSFHALRATSWLAGLGGGLFLYWSARRLSASRFFSIAAGLTLLTNVIYFNLSNTFMTDVPFMAALVAASYFAVAALLDERKFDVSMALISAVAATFIRQYGIVFLALFLAAYIYKRRYDRTTVGFSIGVLGAVVLLLWLFRSWLVAHGLPGCYTVWQIFFQQSLGAGPLIFARSMLLNLMSEIVYLGLFLLPACLGAIPELLRKCDGKERVFFLLCVVELLACISIGLISNGTLMPMTTNVIYHSGVGPVLLGGVGGSHSVEKAALTGSFWTTVTVLSSLGVALITSILIVQFLNYRRTSVPNQVDAGDRSGIAIRFLFASFLLIYTLLIAFTGLIDRYILPASPALTILLAMSTAGNSDAKAFYTATFRACSVLALVLFAYFCVVTTHDYFALNRARWQALNQATGVMKIPSVFIDGGWEFNGWVAYDSPDHAAVVGGALDMRHGDQYAVTLAPVNGCQTVGTWQFHRWLPPGVGTIYLIEQKDDAHR